jgi:hypothetical protein
MTHHGYKNYPVFVAHIPVMKCTKMNTAHHELALFLSSGEYILHHVKGVSTTTNDP